MARLAGRLATTLTRYACRRGTHHYLATSGLHSEHAYCQGATGKAGAKQPAVCKFCKAPCVCPCHRPANDGSKESS